MKKIETNVEINFYQQDEASVYMTSTASGAKEDFGIMLLFSLYTIRTLVNLGRDSKEARGILAMLDEMDTGLKDFAKDKKEVKLVKSTNSRGPKYFIGEMSTDENTKVYYQHKAKGFGIMGKGLGYYAPVSVMAFIKWLANKYEKDNKMFEVVGNTCVGIASVFNNSRVNITDQTSIALQTLAYISPELIHAVTKE